MSGALTQKQLDHLDGNGVSSPMGPLASAVLLGTRLNELAEAQTDVAALEAQTAALGAANTDVQIQIPILSGLADGGTYTKAITSGGVRTITRTAAAAADSLWVEIPVAARSSSGKGIKPTGIRARYTVGTADADDIRVELWKRTIPADGAAPTVAVIAGDQNAHYDAAHDTAAERGDDTGAPELHTINMTIPTNLQAFVADNEELLFRFFADGAATSVIVLTDAVLLATEARVDLT